MSNGYAYAKPDTYVYATITKEDTRFSRVPIYSPPLPPQPDQEAAPGEESKADDVNQDDGKGGEPSASADVTEKGTGGLILMTLMRTMLSTLPSCRTRKNVGRNGK